MERNSGGLNVQLSHLPMTQLTVLTARKGHEQFAVTVPSERALDAFWHPAVYLNATQVERLFGRHA